MIVLDKTKARITQVLPFQNQVNFIPNSSEIVANVFTSDNLKQTFNQIEDFEGG